MPAEESHESMEMSITILWIGLKTCLEDEYKKTGLFLNNPILIIL
jgi:hypothetical protein